MNKYTYRAERSQRRASYLIIATFFILGFLIYSNTFYSPFIFDDEKYINFKIRDLSNFKYPYGTRYVGLLSFALNYYFNGLNTFGYHLVNVVIHILNAILVYLLVQFKEISFTLPFMIILYEFTFFKQFERLERFKRFLYLIPFLLTLVIIPLELFFISGDIVWWMKGDQLRDLTTLSKYNYLLTQFRVIITYIRFIFLPVNQHFAYDYPLSMSMFEMKTFLSFTFLIILIWVLLILRWVIMIRQWRCTKRP